MTSELKKELIEIINENEKLINFWLEEISDEAKDEEYRYYDDFLGFFEECVLVEFSLESPEVEALVHFLEKLIELKGEEEFFDFNGEIYVCRLKYPILKAMEEKGIYNYKNSKEIIDFFDKITSKVVSNIIHKNEEIQASAMSELEEREAPIAKIWHNTLMVSVVGTLDSNRVLKILDKVLESLDKSNIEYVIIDIGSIHDVNSEVARQLMKLNNAVHFMGAKAYLSGITPEIAKSLTHLEVNLGDVKTFSTTYKAMENIVGS